MSNTTNKRITIHGKMVLKYWYVLVILVVLVVFPKRAFGEGLSLGVYPPIIQITAVPPAKIENPITLQNLSDHSVSLNIRLRPFTSSKKENGEVSYLSQNDFFGENPLFFQHIQIVEDDKPIQNLTLSPKQEKKLILDIEIPASEPLSDYYFSVLFISSTTNESSANQSQNIAGIGTNVLISVGPKGETKGFIEEFSTPNISEKGPVSFTLRLKNTGDHFITPKGEIRIKNMFGQTVGQVELKPENILSKTIRAISGRWPETFILGPYSATLTLYLSDSGPKFERTIHFIGFPLKHIVGFIVAMLILVLIRNRIKKHLR